MPLPKRGKLLAEALRRTRRLMNTLVSRVTIQSCYSYRLARFFVLWLALLLGSAVTPLLAPQTACEVCVIL